MSIPLYYEPLFPLFRYIRKHFYYLMCLPLKYFYTDDLPYINQILKISMNNTKYNWFSNGLLPTLWFIQ